MGAFTLVVYLFHGFAVKGAEYAGYASWAEDHAMISYGVTTLAAVLLALTLAWRPVASRLTELVDPSGYAERHVKHAVDLTVAKDQVQPEVQAEVEAGVEAGLDHEVRVDAAAPIAFRHGWWALRASRRRRCARTAGGGLGRRRRCGRGEGDHQGRRRGRRRHRCDAAVRPRRCRRPRAPDDQADHDRVAAQQAADHPPGGAAAEPVPAPAAHADPDGRRRLPLLRGRREGLGLDPRARPPRRPRST